jgi:hypothetical protein
MMDEFAAKKFDMNWMPEPNTGCFLWYGSRVKKGYGQIYIDGTTYLAHRLAWERKHDQTARGLVVRHKCDTPECVNPEHLLIGTYADNSHDAIERNRLACGERNGRYTYPERTARGERNGRYTYPERTARGSCHGTHTHPECVSRGEYHVRAKLTVMAVREIRNLICIGELTQTEIGRRFNVSRAAISNIVQNRAWKQSQ